MKALRLEVDRRLRLVDIEVPAIQANELLIRTGAATICTSDINDIRENPFGIQLPVILGHEAAGTVAEVGALVKGFYVGDRVATHPVHPCGKCAACRDGFRHLCLQMGHFGLNMPGTFAEYYLVREDRARKIQAEVDFPTASLAEPASVCLEALAQARLAPGDNLLIIGDGPFGQIIARLAAALPLSKVVMAGWDSFRLSFARQALPLNTKEVPDPVAMMKAVVGGDGYPAVILAVGSPQALSDGLNCLKAKGRLVVFSALPGQTPVDLFYVHTKELEIIGSCNDQDRLDEAVRMLSDPSLALSELITHRFILADYRQAFELAEIGKGEAMKVSFVF